jgi:uncharacterized protein YidB (DUF937 family)
MLQEPIMGLLDSVLGQVLGGAQPQPQDGGLGGLVSKFEQAGMGDVIGSWIGKGDNAPISGGQLQDVLGSDVISGIAQKLGVNSATLLPMLATLLPTLIDQLTPKGQVPPEGLGNHDDLLSSLSGLLQKS